MKEATAAQFNPSVNSSVERLPTLMQMFEAIEPTGLEELGGVGEVQRSWHLAIAAMSRLLKRSASANRHPDAICQSEPAKICDQQGIIFCGPAPIFSDLATLAHFKTWVFTSQPSYKAFQLPPATQPVALTNALPIVGLRPKDPLAQERFCLIQTPQFCWVAVVGCDGQGGLQFRYSFDPSTVQHLWQALQLRIEYTLPAEQFAQIIRWRQRFSLVVPDYRIPTQFSRELLRQAALDPVFQSQSLRCGQEPDFKGKTTVAPSWHEHASLGSEEEGSEELTNSAPDRDAELIKVIAHEVRTPLTTIQTLTRLLLKRSDLPEDVIQRLEAIYRECSGQIDRFGLIFRAMELTHDRCQALPNRLMPISLQEILEENLGRWEIQAARRSLTLEVTTPKHMPAIAIRDPHLLDQVLTGLMEYLGHSLSAGSHIHLHVALAGPQLKLQLKTRTDETDSTFPSPMLEAVGQLLMFQPETGGLSLSLPVTKHLFQALGGKLTVRKHQQSEVLTIFLPLGVESDAY
jgi:signal transduction histidine kinase